MRSGARQARPATPAGPCCRRIRSCGPASGRRGRFPSDTLASSPCRTWPNLLCPPMSQCVDKCLCSERTPARARATIEESAVANAPARAATSCCSRGRCCSEFVVRNRSLPLSDPFPGKPRFGSTAVDLQRALFADGIRPDEDPVLPGGQPAKDFRKQSLGTTETETRFHSGERIRRETRTLLDCHSELIFPIEFIGRERHQPRFERLFGIPCFFQGFRDVVTEPRRQPRSAVDHGV